MSAAQHLRSYRRNPLVARSSQASVSLERMGNHRKPVEMRPPRPPRPSRDRK